MMTDPAAQTPVDDYVFLLGRPPVSEFLGFIRNMAIDGQTADQGVLADEWRSANDHLRSLESAEAGIANNVPTQPIPEELAPVVEALVQDPVFHQAFRTVPTELAMVELDRLVVYQKFINLGFVEQLKGSLSSPPTDVEVATLAFALAYPFPDVQYMQQSANAFSFVSRSSDFRFLDGKLVAPQQVTGFVTTGRPFAYLVLAVGFGSNYLNAIEIEGRLILNNGSHRAYALRDLGLTHAPCVIQKVGRRDELELTGPADVQQNPDRFLSDPRPALLKDYFDPQLTKTVQVPRKNRMVRLQYGFEWTDTPAT